MLVPEFIDFFTSPVHVRSARSAASAARMSLDMLVLDREAFFADDEMLLNIDGGASDSVVQTHVTNYLDSGASKLISVWPYVEKDMLEHYRSQFESDESPLEDDGTTGLLPCDVFKVPCHPLSYMMVVHLSWLLSTISHLSAISLLCVDTHIRFLRRADQVAGIGSEQEQPCGCCRRH